jgi:hypothetical protein
MYRWPEVSERRPDEGVFPIADISLKSNYPNIKPRLFSVENGWNFSFRSYG